MLRTLLPVVALLAGFAAVSVGANTLLPSELAKPGRVLVLRHATAPGIGDPPGFRLGDCSTQRNLDGRGRTQAIELGKRLSRAGVVRARVFSSQWCRCLETARLLALGPVEALPALNSFFGQGDEREARTQALRVFLSKLPPDGTPVVLVTHQVNISDLTGRAMASGAAVILALDGTEEPHMLGEIEAR
ncbi:MAG: histidine phosphatase family protein [Casimicrobiaceae bacterium]